jgi:hypothetical protein
MQVLFFKFWKSINRLKNTCFVPHVATFLLFIAYVIASTAYIHPVQGGIQTHDPLDVSLFP